VRPNGFAPIARPAPPPPSAERNGTLRLAHFGLISPARIEPRRFLDALAASSRWRTIEWHQYGNDWSGSLADVSPMVDVVHHEPRPWPEVVRDAAQFDAAIVLGNRDRGQLPSKAVSYLTLPIPRIAVVGGDRQDALSDYVRDKRGWLVVAGDDLETDVRVAQHVSRPWSSVDLEPPAAERWDRVAPEIARFVDRLLA
jgi:hypothetical protein